MDEAPLVEQHAIALRTGNRVLQWWRAHDLARLDTARGDLPRAIERLQQTLALVCAGQRVLGELGVGADFVVLYARAGHVDAARPLLARCRAVLAAGENWRGLAGCVALAEAALAAIQGQPESAARRFDQAVACFRHYTLLWEEAEAPYVWGCALLTAGDDALPWETLNGRWRSMSGITVAGSGQGGTPAGTGPFGTSGVSGRSLSARDGGTTVDRGGQEHARDSGDAAHRRGHRGAPCHQPLRQDRRPQSSRGDA